MKAICVLCPRALFCKESWRALRYGSKVHRAIQTFLDRVCFMTVDFLTKLVGGAPTATLLCCKTILSFWLSTI